MSYPEIEAALREHLKCNQIEKAIPVAGGCINDNYKYITDRGPFFIKVNEDAKAVKMFEAEAEGLRALAETQTFRIPEVYHFGELKHGGRQLAKLHSYRDAEVKSFGFICDNTIGSTPQINTWEESWIDFFKARLEYQLALCREKFSELYDQAYPVVENISIFFRDIPSIEPSLLHGDLWLGNCDVDNEGRWVLYDPATYWGHSEAELSILTLFSRPPQCFWEEYREYVPQAPGFDQRHELYSLYHSLNHLNIFGAGYLSMSLGIIQKLRRALAHLHNKD
ncbi:hypothetical protein K7432_013427 [Basidiobolus ranarum]|uniref:protein-ribulosamine 3-kinase n=1 Tax=Basidiobolus ranarum TaxID=34480 RepID=A0ABR2WJ93_9FUNG